MTSQRVVAHTCSWIVTALSFLHAASAGPLFIPLGQLPGDGSFKSSAATDISADGSVVVGSADVGPNHREAFRWTIAEGMVGIGDLPGGSFHSQAFAVSPDGNTIVGDSVSSTAQESFRWAASDDMTALGQLPGSPGGFSLGAASDVSNSGVIVGHSVGQGNNTRAYRWTATEGMTAIGALPGGSFSGATAITPDSSVIVGFSQTTAGREAFRWTEAGGMVGLGDLPGGDVDSVAYGISANGVVVVGSSRTAPLPTAVQEYAFRWTSATGMVSLGDIPGGSGDNQALDVSADGSVIVGRAARNNRFYAMRWDAASGMHSVEVLLANAGVDMTGWQLEHAGGVSADGTAIVGFGINPSGQREAWLVSGLQVPEPTGAIFPLIAATMFYSGIARRCRAAFRL